ncbi:hypothetical protein EPN52_12565 [bacterium]|nr:MAG: hypothetical protein EPN52_12565 [bacterium]
MTTLVTNPGKVLFPGEGITKGDLVAYYQRVCARILPYLAGRPLMLERYPNGLDGEHFFEKDAPRGAPSWLKTVALRSESADRTIHYVLCEDERTLLYLANLAAVTLHPWQSRVGHLDEPDILLFDLDPMPGCGLARLARVALLFRDTLSALGLRARVKTTGGKGLHVIVSLAPSAGYAQVRDFAETVSRHIAQGSNDVTLERSVERRRPRTVSLDYLQIGRGKTFAAPFTVRARRSAPVSMPLAWSEVEAWSAGASLEPTLAFARWTIASAAALPDPWRASYGPPQRLEPALERAARRWRNV